MKWFKHDSGAHRDAKLKRLRIRYGIKGYGLYWYLLELIAGAVGKDNVTFELEDDAELVALEWGMDQGEVEEIMEFMVSLGLFSTSEDTNRIACLKLANRLDESSSRHPEIRAAVAGLRNKSRTSPEQVLNDSGTDKIRLDQNRSENKNKSDSVESKGRATKELKKPSRFHGTVIAEYHKILPELTGVTVSRWAGSQRERDLNTRLKEDLRFQSESFWTAFFETVRTNSHWMGDNDRKWKADLGWLLKRGNFDKVIEWGLGRE